MIEGLANNDHLLLKNAYIDKVEFEFLNNPNFRIIDSSFLKFLRTVDYNKTNFFKNLKINQFNFKFVDSYLIKKKFIV